MFIYLATFVVLILLNLNTFLIIIIHVLFYLVLSILFLHQIFHLTINIKMYFHHKYSLKYIIKFLINLTLLKYLFLQMAFHYHKYMRVYVKILHHMNFNL